MILQQLLLFVVYVLAGRVGLSLAFVHDNTSAVWPPTGIALAAMVLSRCRVWPAVFAGAFVVNATTLGAVPSAVIAAGNALEAVVGACLVWRFARGVDVFGRPGDVVRFALVAAVASAVSATNGATTLAVSGSASWAAYGSIWLTWWLGDVAGALLVAPPIILWARAPRPAYTGRRAVEAALMLVAALGTSVVVFGVGTRDLGLSSYPLAFLAVPPLIWAALRFGPREASTLTLLTAGLATWGTVRGHSALVAASPHEALLVLEAFMATIAGTTLPAAAVVAERARSQERLAASELAYRAMFEPNPVPMWVIDASTTRFLAVNDAAILHYGYSHDEFLSMTIADIRPASDLPRVDRARQEVAARGRYHGHHRHRTKDGRMVDVEINSHRIEFAGQPAALILANDVTERLAAQERERQARADAEAANRAKDDFLATVSHELRTPLNAVLGWIVMLRDGSLPPEEHARALETVERNARHQIRLIEDLLDVSGIVADKLALDMRRLVLAPVVHAAVDTVRLAAESKGVTIDVAVAPAVPEVEGDAERLQQIVRNLVANAVKFTPSGGRVAVEVTPCDRGARVAVTDTGEGIAPDFLPHVFDRFRQADATTTRQHGGLGLGLTIVRHLVAGHGGTVRAESPGVGRGASFIVDLPAAGMVVRPRRDG